MKTFRELREGLFTRKKKLTLGDIAKQKKDKGMTQDIVNDTRGKPTGKSTRSTERTERSDKQDWTF